MLDSWNLARNAWSVPTVWRMRWPRLKPSTPRHQRFGDPSGEDAISFFDVFCTCHILSWYHQQTAALNWTLILKIEDHRYYNKVCSWEFQAIQCYPGSSAKQCCQRSCSKGTKGPLISMFFRRAPWSRPSDSKAFLKASDIWQIILVPLRKGNSNWRLLFVAPGFLSFVSLTPLQEAESRVEELEALLLQERRERQKEKEAFISHSFLYQTCHNLWSLW